MGQDADGDAESMGMSLGMSLGATTLGSTVAAGLDPPAGVQAMRAAPRARARSKRVRIGEYLLGYVFTAATARGVAAGRCVPTDGLTLRARAPRPPRAPPGGGFRRLADVVDMRT